MISADPNETRLYLLPIAEAERISPDFCRDLFPERFSRAERMKAEDRNAALSAGLLLCAAGITERDLVLGKFGKPTAPTKDFCFSISHGGGFTALALAPSAVGADIEPIAAPRPSARRYMTEEELGFIAPSPAENFTKLWTLKESLSKCDGRGLSLGFSSLSALPLARGETLAFAGKNYCGRTFSVDGCLVSAVTEQRNTVILLPTLSAEDLAFDLGQRYPERKNGILI